MKQKKRHFWFILITPLLLLLLFPLLVANSSSPQAISETKEPIAPSPDGTLPFDPREVVERSSGTGVIDPLVSKYTTLVAASDWQREPRVAYNSTDNRYLVVWDDMRDGSNYHIYGQRVDGNGKLLGSNIAIFSIGHPTQYPDVAYNSHDNNWLVVFQYDYPSVGDWDIVCRRVNSNGTTENAYWVANPSTSNQQYPRVAYNSTDNNFCVVWEDYRDAATNDWEVYSRIVTGAGVPTGSENPVVGYSTNQLNPAIAYLPSVNGYLVAYEEEWDYTTTNWDISCKRLDEDGLPLTTSSPYVVKSGNTQRNPEVAANTINDNFLVVWQDYRSGSHYDVYGQRMSSVPAKVGSEITICTQSDGQYQPAVCYSPTYNKYLVAWADFRPGPGLADIYGQLISSTGSLEGGNVTLSSLSGVSEVYPHLAWNSSYRNFYLVQQDNRNSGTTGYDIFGRKVTYESAVVTGMGYGGSSWYKAFDIYGRPYQTVKAFGGVNPNGEIDVEVADIWNDGTPEVIVAHGSGGASWIKIFNYDGTFYTAIKCFGPGNTGGQVHLAVGDFAVGDDLEIAVATGRNGNNWVKVFETSGTLRANFKAYGPANSQGEIYLAAADFDGDGKDEIITGTGIGGNSKVKIFSGSGTFMSSFDAFGSENTKGSIHLTAGNFDPTSAAKEIAVATGYGGTNRVKIFQQDGTFYSSFVAFGMGGNPNGSVHISAVDSSAFGGWMMHEILCAHGQGGSSWVKLFNYAGFFMWSFKAYGGVNANGEVYVSGCLSH